MLLVSVLLRYNSEACALNPYSPSNLCCSQVHPILVVVMVHMGLPVSDGSENNITPPGEWKSKHTWSSSEDSIPERIVRPSPPPHGKGQVDDEDEDEDEEEDEHMQGDDEEEDDDDEEDEEEEDEDEDDE